MSMRYSHKARVLYHEATCPICLDVVEPPMVVLFCGHTVCPEHFECLHGKIGSDAMMSFHEAYHRERLDERGGGGGVRHEQQPQPRTLPAWLVRQQQQGHHAHHAVVEQATTAEYIRQVEEALVSRQASASLASFLRSSGRGQEQQYERHVDDNNARNNNNVNQANEIN